MSARATSGMPHAYVTAPTRRAYQTPENELLVFMLDGVGRLAKETAWLERATRRPGEDLASRFDAAMRTGQHRALQSVVRGPITPRKIGRVRSGRGRRRYQAVLDAYDAYTRFVGRRDPQAIRDAVEHLGLVTRSDSTLFELLTTFGILDALEQQGWQMAQLRVFGGSLRTRGAHGDAEIHLWYQSVPRELVQVSRYRSLVRAHGMPGSTLIPDLVFRLRRGGEVRYLIVETKLGDDSRRVGRSVEESARAALKDLLMYRMDYSEVLVAQPAPSGLGVAWGAELSPVVGEIMLTTPDNLGQALELWTK